MAAPQQPAPEYDDAVARAPGQTAAQDKERDFRATADAIIGPAPTGVIRGDFGQSICSHNRTKIQIAEWPTQFCWAKLKFWQVFSNCVVIPILMNLKLT